MTIKDDIDRILRDHEGYTGDGQGGKGALPIGDRSTPAKPISKRDLREVLGATYEAVAVSAGQVEDARDKAREWAENPEDVPVEPGEFSALHHAAKAGDTLADFLSRYLGVLTANPTQDANGNPVTDGATYFNSATNEWRIRVGGSWVLGVATGVGVLLAANNLSDLDNAGTARGNLGLGDLAVEDGPLDITKGGTGAATASDALDNLGVDIATMLQFAAATAGKFITTDSVWGNLAQLTDGANIAVNFNNGYDFGGASNKPLSLGNNRTLSNPTNARTGKKGILWFTRSGAARTLTLAANWKLAEGVEEGPYSIASNEVLGIAYACYGTTTVVTGVLWI